MIERDFKELLQKIEQSDDVKKNLNSIGVLVMKTIEDYTSKNVKVIDVNLIEPFKDSYYLENEREIDIYLVLIPKNKSLPYDLLKRVCINEVENALLFNIKNNQLLENNEARITRNDDEDVLKIVIDNANVAIHFYYRKDSLLKIDSLLEEKTLIYEDYLRQRRFQSEAINEYPKFKKVVKLIKYFSKAISFDYQNLEIIKVILYYGLKNYYYNSDYSDYLKSFVAGLTDFIDGKIISIGDEKYKALDVAGIVKNTGRYNVIDSGNKSNNLTLNIIDVSGFKKLKSEIITKLPKDGAFVKIDVSPRNLTTKTLEWHFEIIDSETENSGGEYENNEDNYFMCSYRALLKALQFVVKEKLGNNITVYCENLSPFSSETLSYENESRFANIKTFIKENDLAINYVKR